MSASPQMADTSCLLVVFLALLPSSKGLDTILRQKTNIIDAFTKDIQVWLKCGGLEVTHMWHHLNVSRPCNTKHTFDIDERCSRPPLRVSQTDLIVVNISPETRSGIEAFCGRHYLAAILKDAAQNEVGFRDVYRCAVSSVMQLRHTGERVSNAHIFPPH